MCVEELISEEGKRCNCVQLVLTMLRQISKTCVDMCDEMLNNKNLDNSQGFLSRDFPTLILRTQAVRGDGELAMCGVTIYGDLWRRDCATW